MNGGVMDSLRITYGPRLDATPEVELEALAAVFAFLIETHKRRQTSSEADEAFQSRPKGVSIAVDQSAEQTPTGT
jgi:hypothetical protein